MNVLLQLAKKLQENLLMLCVSMIGILLAPSLSAQSYTYAAESFEEAAWSSAPNNSNTINATTGAWKVAKNNIRSTATAAQDGEYSLTLATKTDALVSPMLENGAGILTYHVIKPSGGTRVIWVQTSKDNVTWSRSVDSVVVISPWMLRRAEILDPEVRYIRFTTNSNGSVFLDNVLITSGGAVDVTVMTAAATDITQTTALVGGTITAGGSTAILSRGVCYNTTGFPDINSDKLEVPGTSGTFNGTLTELTPGTNYYVKTYAVTAAGVNYGEEVSFSTRSADAPVAYWTQPFNDNSHMPASNPSSPVSIEVPGQGTWIFQGAFRATNQLYIKDGSVSNLRIVKNGAYVITPLLEDGVTDVTFLEGRGERELTIYTSTDGGSTWTLLQTISTVKEGNNTILVNSAAVNRIKIANESGGDADIDNLTVTVFPSGTVPTLTTTAVTAIGKNTATTGGVITAEGAKPVVDRGVSWSTSPTPIIADNKVSSGAGAGAFTAVLTDLPAGTQIYARAYATSRSGTAYGNVLTFTTAPATTPAVATVTATEVTGESARSGGTITDGGGAPITAKGVAWNTTGDPTTADNKTTDETGNENFQTLLTDLNPNTTYYYRAYATNEAGTGYGTVLSFTTGSVRLPAVTTADITAILSYKATGGGNVTDNGNARSVSGIVWNTTGTPTTNDSKTADSQAAGVFTSTLANLTGNTRYYVRAYVTNSVGTAYGNEITFTTAPAATVYVAPTGNDETGNGSRATPFYSLQKAVDIVEPGDSIIMQGGTYRYSTRINIRKSGAPDGGTFYVFAAKGQRALLDFSAMPLDPNNQGIRLTGSYWHLYGLDIKGAGDNGLLIERNKPTGGTFQDVMARTHEGNYNTIEFCSFFDNKDTGLQLKNMAEHNRIINCDAYFNRDAEDGNADGFAPKLTVGTGNYFYGCRAWNNSDDGWDMILNDADVGFPDDMTTVMENCWAFGNGFLKNGQESKGNGNGFKLGGSGNKDRKHNIIMLRCVAFDNLMKGFDQNHNVGDMTLINCSGYARPYLANKNHFTYKIDAGILAPGKKLTLINSLAVWDGKPAATSLYAPHNLEGGIRITSDFMTSASDFVSIDTIGVTGPRKADGSLPDLNFLKIKPGNMKLIDQGTIVEGISFNGLKPDIGAFETLEILTALEKEDVNQPGLLTQLQNYPNPFEQNTTITYVLEEASQVAVQVYSVHGQLVATIIDGAVAAGNQQVNWNAADFQTGVYYLKITALPSNKPQAAPVSRVRRMLLLK